MGSAASSCAAPVGEALVDCAADANKCCLACREHDVRLRPFGHGLDYDVAGYGYVPPDGLEAAALDADEAWVAACRNQMGLEGASLLEPPADRSSDSSPLSAPPPSPEMRQIVRDFMNQYVRGRELPVLTPKGGFMVCAVSLDKRLSCLSVRNVTAEETPTRSIPLHSVEDVVLGDRLGVAAEEALCATMILQDGKAIAFVFDDSDEREIFALCLRTFVEARKTELRHTTVVASRS